MVLTQANSRLSVLHLFDFRQTFHVHSPVHEILPPANATPTPRRANATIVMLPRNSDVDKAAHSIRQPFSEESKSYVSKIIPFVSVSQDFASRTSLIQWRPILWFSLIPALDWNPPEWIDDERAEKAREDFLKVGAIHGASVILS
ncbi:glycosyltransferase family 15 protein [Sphaerobolus stellatus SS14]|uniref:Glycosyltransferase family 15 protein n=1 Tax=Sphaerobolus stellatus (strain SS14) TaxID=990650 RepID=A0A0C9VEB6_SPHS4|nr:glycosyltransferase family 15 protein [Sphaerobolus stellatus SS14]